MLSTPLFIEVIISSQMLFLQARCRLEVRSEILVGQPRYCIATTILGSEAERKSRSNDFAEEFGPSTLHLDLPQATGLSMRVIF
jgi:hypothetical protein